MRARGADVSYTLPVDFLEAAKGARKRVTVGGDQQTIDLTIPAGVRDRQTLRLKGQGMPGFEGGPPGDAYVEVHIQPHALFERKDNDIHVELPVSLAEAVLGGRIQVPTIDGPVSMTVPKGSNTGATLRLRGKRHRRPEERPARRPVRPAQGGAAEDARSPSSRSWSSVGEEPPLRPARRTGGAHEDARPRSWSLLGRVDRVELHSLGRARLGRARAAGAAAEPAFSELDVARVRLICDLRHDLAVEEETVPLVLSLLDQVYALRRQMSALTERGAASSPRGAARDPRSARASRRAAAAAGLSA